MVVVVDRANLVRHVRICGENVETDGSNNRCPDCVDGDQAPCGRFFFERTATDLMFDAEMSGCISASVFHWRHLQWLRLLTADLLAIGDHMEMSIQNLVSELNSC